MISFNTEQFIKDAYMPKCEHPILTRNGYVPCGCCPQCLSKSKKDWITRLNCEHRTSKSSCFLTLTFDDEHVNDCGYGEIQRFLKRYRYYYKNKIKYFGCFERGDMSGRAHFHLLIFGHYPPLEKGYRTNSEFLADKVWKNGFVKVEPLNFSSIKYVAAYVAKKFDYKQIIAKRGVVNYRQLRYFNKYSPNDDWCNILTKKELPQKMSYYFMSKGIGFDYLWQNLDRILKTKAICFQGNYVAIPRAFYKKIKEYDFPFEYEPSPVRCWIIEKFLKKSMDTFRLVDVPSFFAKYKEIMVNVAKRYAYILYVQKQSTISFLVHRLRP